MDSRDRQRNSVENEELGAFDHQQQGHHRPSWLPSLDIDDELQQARHARHERMKDSQYFRTLQQFEHQCYQWRVRHPVLFNLGVAQSVLATFIVSAYIRS